MSEINKLIKDLRNKTGAGFLDCKNALSENQNDINKAIDYLRKKGLAKASKKTSREANEGAVGVYSNDSIIVLLKVNSETDFAAKSDAFLNFLDELGNCALKANNIYLKKEDFLNLKFNEGTVLDYINEMIAKIGENLILNDLLILKNNELESSYYVHNNYKENIGKIIALIQYKTNKIDDKIKTLAKNICMHIAAMKPESLDVDDLDKDLVNNERNIQKELIVSSGKPENIIDKILEGKMKKFYSDVTLLNQPYILDQDKTIKLILNEFSKEYDYKIVSFNLFNLS